MDIGAYNGLYILPGHDVPLETIPPAASTLCFSSGLFGL